MKLATLLFFFLQLGLLYSESQFSVAFLTDTHIGDYQGEVALIKTAKAVDAINANIQKYNISLVFHTGDVTDKADPKSFREVYPVLQKLKVRWFPLIGNHDLLSFNDTWSADKPEGDVLFANTFKSQFLPTPGLVYNNQPTWNPEHRISSWFQNFEYRYEDVIFFGLDWCTRTKHIVNGTLPLADLHDFPGGTFQWLRSRLKNIKEQGVKPKSIVFVQHHSFDTWIFPRWYMGFIEEKRIALMKLLSEYLPISAYWGVFSGHIHRWFDGRPFSERGWENFRQWETYATKYEPAVTVATFRDSKIVKIEKLLGP